uniref:Uncharacterized protein n=1 Tax=Bionectria ochroleuca TaxID=29856 RepID=A0A0B7JZS7_BIOOC
MPGTGAGTLSLLLVVFFTYTRPHPLPHDLAIIPQAFFGGQEGNGLLKSKRAIIVDNSSPVSISFDYTALSRVKYLRLPGGWFVWRNIHQCSTPHIFVLLALPQRGEQDPGVFTRIHKEDLINSAFSENTRHRDLPISMFTV